ncbi:MAG: glycosyltransferase family 4 protein [Candidatus Competibacter sp.]
MELYEKKRLKIIFFANTDWYLFNFRLPLALSLKAMGHEVLLISPPGPYGVRLQATGCRWLPLPMERRSLNPWKEIRLLRYLSKLYRREQPNLAHHFTLKCVVYGAIAAWVSGTKLSTVSAITGLGHVFTSDTARTRILRPLLRNLLRFCMNRPSSRLILQNQDDKNELLRYRLVDDQNIRLIRGSGVNTHKFQPRLNIRQPGPFQVLLATRLLWDKGVGEYVDAARQLYHEGLGIQFQLAGLPDPGNPASVPKKTIEEWRREGLINVLGHVDNMELLLANIDLMVLPSYREGTPRSLLEAASCGLPIITTDVIGCREVVEHGVNGLLVPPRDAHALAAAIRNLYNDPINCQRLGQAGRTKALTQFDEQIVIKQTLAVYQELIGGLQ